MYSQWNSQSRKEEHRTFFITEYPTQTSTNLSCLYLYLFCRIHTMRREKGWYIRGLSRSLPALISHYFCGQCLRHGRRKKRRSRSSSNSINWNRKREAVKRDRTEFQYQAVFSGWTTTDLFSKSSFYNGYWENS